MKMEHFILDVLQGKLSVNDEEVRLIQAPPQDNNMPTLTIDNSAGTHTLNSNKTNITVNNRRQEAIVTEYETDLRLDIWALSEEDRQTLIEQVQTCFYQALSDHYQYCSRYNDGDCESLESPCLATSRDYALDKRAIKHQCPCPHELDYENLWTRYHIDIASFTLNPAYDLDELNETEPVLRSRFDISFNYKDYYIIGGKTSTDLINKEDTLHG